MTQTKVVTCRDAGLAFVNAIDFNSTEFNRFKNILGLPASQSPVVAGDTHVGSTLALSTTYSFSGASPITVTRQWYYLNGADIPGANSDTYVLTTNDIGKQIAFRATGTNMLGSTTVSTALASGVIVAAEVILSPPVLTSAAPTVSGTLTVGETLTVSNTTWSGKQPITVTRQWIHYGIGVLEAFGDTYTLISSDVGKDIRCAITAVNADGTVQVMSAGLGSTVQPAQMLYNLTSNGITSFNEGAGYTFTVNTTNVPDSTVLYWKVVHGTSSNADFSESLPYGEVVITNNIGSLGVYIKPDNLTEGAETFVINIYSDSEYNLPLAGSNQGITINDTSTTPLPTWSISTDKTSYNEGDLITCTITTTNVANGTPFVLWLANNGLVPTDFEDNSGQYQLTVTGPTTTYSARLVNDLTTEGTESFTAAICSGTTWIQSNLLGQIGPIQVNDTSL